MLIKKIDNMLDLPKINEGYRSGMITNQQLGDLVFPVITVVSGSEKLFFHLDKKVCANPQESLKQLVSINRDFRSAEVYGEFTPEVVCFLRENNYHVNLIPCPLFSKIKNLSVYRVSDIEELDFQDHVRIGTVLMHEGKLAYQQSEEDLNSVDAVLVSLDPISTVSHLLEILDLISNRVKKANVYIQCDNGLSKLMTEKGMKHYVY